MCRRATKPCGDVSAKRLALRGGTAAPPHPSAASPGLAGLEFPDKLGSPGTHSLPFPLLLHLVKSIL